MWRRLGFTCCFRIVPPPSTIRHLRRAARCGVSRLIAINGEIRFLEPMSLSILSQHRAEGPYGLEGGGPGLPGRQRLLRADGTTEELAAIDGRDVAAGDRLLLETPGGGGYGEPTIGA